MKSFRIVLSLLGMALTASPVSAELLDRSPEVVVLPTDGSGESKVAFRCNVGGMRQGLGLVIQSAVIEWTLPGMPSDRMSEFRAHRMRPDWGLLGPSVLDIEEALGTSSEATLHVFPQDHARVGRKVMTLDVTSLAREAVAGSASEISILMVTPTISTQRLAQGIAGVRFKVRYGFLGVIAPLFPDGQ